MEQPSSSIEIEIDEEVFPRGVKREDQECEDENGDFFAPHFIVPEEEWALILNVKGIGQILMHRVTYKPIMILCHMNEQGEVIGHEVCSQNESDFEHSRCLHMPLPLRENTEETSCEILFYLLQIGECYASEGILQSEEDIERRLEFFLQTLNLTREEEVAEIVPERKILKVKRQIKK